ncbi:MAG: hypothetical protein ACK4NT_07615 [Candidatus Omnitrophota bacterium]
MRNFGPTALWTTEKQLYGCFATISPSIWNLYAPQSEIALSGRFQGSEFVLEAADTLSRDQQIILRRRFEDFACAPRAPPLPEGIISIRITSHTPIDLTTGLHLLCALQDNIILIHPLIIESDEKLAKILNVTIEQARLFAASCVADEILHFLGKDHAAGILEFLRGNQKYLDAVWSVLREENRNGIFSIKGFSVSILQVFINEARRILNGIKHELTDRKLPILPAEVGGVFRKNPDEGIERQLPLFSFVFLGSSSLIRVLLGLCFIAYFIPDSYRNSTKEKRSFTPSEILDLVYSGQIKEAVGRYTLLSPQLQSVALAVMMCSFESLLSFNPEPIGIVPQGR